MHGRSGCWRRDGSGLGWRLGEGGVERKLGLRCVQMVGSLGILLVSWPYSWQKPAERESGRAGGKLLAWNPVLLRGLDRQRVCEERQVRGRCGRPMGRVP